MFRFLNTTDLRGGLSGRMRLAFAAEYADGIHRPTSRLSGRTAKTTQRDRQGLVTSPAKPASSLHNNRQTR